MIVPVSSEKYKNLFAAANDFLSKATDRNGNLLYEEVKEITNLNSYYGHMNDFFAAAKQGNREGYRYIMMPLKDAGEEVFKVDLNSRTITVPPTFSKIGAVQSDQMAELIVFSADRYFDYMDLANTNIYVQWQLPYPDSNGNPIGGATPITIIDLESEPGKMLFAWPLHKDITTQSGHVKFSLRFFLVDASNTNLVYSLNTQSANLLVHAALDVTEILQPDDLSLFEKSIVNSGYAEAGVLPASQPLFEKPGLDLDVMDYDNCFVREEGSGTAKKTIIAKLDENNELKLIGQAIVNDAGNLSYRWGYRPSDNENGGAIVDGDADFPGEVSDYYKEASFPIDVITKQPYLSGSERYYFKDGENYELYTSNAMPEEGVVLYEHYSVMTIDPDASKVTGSYFIDAVNTTSEIPRREAERRSRYCILPAPANIEFKKDNIFTIVGENEKIEVNIAEDINKPSYNIAWFKDVESEEGAVEKAAPGSEASSVEMNDGAKLAPGWYAARVTAKLNKTEKSVGTNVAQAIYADPEITEIAIVGDQSRSLMLHETTQLEVKVITPIPQGFEEPEEGKEDEAKGVDLYRNLSYRWQYQLANENKWRDITPKMAGSDKLVEGDVNSNILTVHAIDNNAYKFQCIVTNTLGNKSITMAQADAEGDSYFVVY